MDQAVTVRRLLALLVLLLTTGCGAISNLNPSGPAPSPPPSPTPAAPSTPTAFYIEGVITIDTDGFDAEEGDACLNSSPYDDVTVGSAVTVTDAGGAVVGLGDLADSQAVVSDGYASSCTFRFTVYDVPEGQKFYGIEVAHRGVVRFPRSELKDPVELTLG